MLRCKCSAYPMKNSTVRGQSRLHPTLRLASPPSASGLRSYIFILFLALPSPVLPSVSNTTTTQLSYHSRASNRLAHSARTAPPPPVASWVGCTVFLTQRKTHPFPPTARCVLFFPRPNICHDRQVYRRFPPMDKAQTPRAIRSAPAGL